MLGSVWIAKQRSECKGDLFVAVERAEVNKVGLDERMQNQEEWRIK